MWWGRACLRMCGMWSTEPCAPATPRAIACRPEDVLDHASYQRHFLRTAARLLRDGGEMVYSTCTLTAEARGGGGPARRGVRVDRGRVDVLSISPDRPQTWTLDRPQDLTPHRPSQIDPRSSLGLDRQQADTELVPRPGSSREAPQIRP